MKRTILLLSTFMLSLLSCSEKKQAGTVTDEPVIDVTTQKVKTSSTSSIQASGTVQAVSSSVITTRQSGYVERINVEVGDKVKAGEVLIRLDNAQLASQQAQVKSKIKTAQTAFNNARKDLERYKKLRKNNSVSEKELEQVQLQYDNARSNLEAAQEQLESINAELDYVNIKAPFDGRVTNKFIKTGNLAMPGKPLLNLHGDGQLEVVSKVGEEQINQLEKRQTANVHIASLDIDLEAKLTELSSSSSASGGQYIIKLSIPDDQAVKPGMYAEVNINAKLKDKNTSISIPESALIYTNDLIGVYTVSKSNTAILRWLEIGSRNADSVEVLSGLDQGEEIIINAQGKLYNGAKINVQ
jgi:RND family efflux transporter MFP subunit